MPKIMLDVGLHGYSPIAARPIYSSDQGVVYIMQFSRSPLKASYSPCPAGWRLYIMYNGTPFKRTIYEKDFISISLNNSIDVVGRGVCMEWMSRDQ